MCMCRFCVAGLLCCVAGKRESVEDAADQEGGCGEDEKEESRSAAALTQVIPSFASWWM